MEKLSFTDQKTSNRKFDIAIRVVVSLLLTFSVFKYMKDFFLYPVSFPLKGEWKVSDGLATFWNSICDTFGYQDFILLNRVDGQVSTAFVFVALSCIVCFIVSYLILLSKKSGLIVLYVVPPLLLCFLYKLPLSLTSVAILCFSTLIAVVYMRKGEKILSGWFFIVGLIVLISFSIANSYLFNHLVMDFGPAVHTRELVSMKIDNIKYGSQGGLNQGDYTISKMPNRNKETALEVAMSNPQSMYLKGFVGDVCTNSGWKTNSNSLYYGKLSLMNELRNKGFNATGQIGQVASFTYPKVKDESNKISIKPVKASKEFAYIPYEVKDLGTLKDRAIKGGDELYCGQFGIFKDYVYTAYDNKVETWTDISGRNFTRPPVNKSLAKEQKEYIKCESYYNEFVYSAYTELNAEQERLAESVLGEFKYEEQGHLEYKKAINAIRSYLESYKYTENMTAVFGQASSPLNGVFNKRAGYDSQYATVATLLFRHYGIPARYVEGYIITPSDVKGMKSGETIKVPEARAHSWCEIYIDGIGFVPLETCPKYYGLMREADMTIGISDSVAQSPITISLNNNNSHRSDDNGGSGGGNGSQKWMFWILLVALLIALIYLLYRFFKYLFAMVISYLAFKRLIKGDDRKLAVASIFDYMEKKGYTISKEAYELGNLAAYSREDITEEQRLFMLAEMKNGKEKRCDR